MNYHGICKKEVLGIAALIIVIIFSNGAGASRQISNCQEISTQGDQVVLSGNIIGNSTNGECIRIIANNVVLDGADKSIIGNAAVPITIGVHVDHVTNVTIKNLYVSNWTHGIYLDNSNNNYLTNNNVLKNTGAGLYSNFSDNNNISSNFIYNNFGNGLFLPSSNNNIIKNNVIINNGLNGILIFRSNPFSLSNNNTLTGNNVSYNQNSGIQIGVFSRNNSIYNNNLMNNNNQSIDNTGTNLWNGSYPTGGNYWSDYTGVDIKKGSNQDQLGSDGIGDFPNNVGGGARDIYPLMTPFGQPVYSNGGGEGGVDRVEIRGDVATGIYLWDAYNFGGFFYDFRGEKWTETLDVSSISGRDIPVDYLIYKTHSVTRDYQVYINKNKRVNGESNYSLVGWQGKSYVALKGKANKLVHLLLEHTSRPGDTKVLSVGERWYFADGYSIKADSINLSGNIPTTRLIFYQNDIEVKNESVQQEDVFNYSREIAGLTNVTVFATYVDNVSTDGTNDLIRLNYSWLISEDTMIIKNDDIFGKLKVTASSDYEVVLKNDAVVTLSKNSDINIMGRLKFKVADNDNLRYYPYVESTTPGTYEIRGTVTNTAFEWTAHNFSGFFYDLKDDRMTETLNVSSLSGSNIPIDNLIYKTHPSTRNYQVYKNKNKLVNGESNYSLVGWQGQRYIAIKGKANKLVDLLLEHTSRPDDTKVLTVGEVWDISEGYSISTQSISPFASPPTARLVFYKNGIEIKNESVQQGAVYTYTKEMAGETDVIVFATYIDRVSTDGTNDLVYLNYSWLISDNVNIIQPGIRFNKLIVTTASDSEVVLKNDAAIPLSGESIIDIMERLRFKVNNNMRYYPFVTVNVTNTIVPPTNNVCASLCHNYMKRLDRSIDFYPNTMTSFDQYETFLGFLNEMRGTPMNVTDPTIDFHYDPSELNGSSYDHFRKVQPSYQQAGHFVFEFQDMTLSNGNGTYGVDEGERLAKTGFDASRKVENNGLITKDGYLNVTVSGILYENINNYIALSAGLWNTSEFNVWVVNWTSSEPVDYQDIRPENVFVHFRTEGKTLPRRYDLNVTFYVDKIIPPNITLKPRIEVNTRNNLQHNEIHGSNVTVNGTMFKMNSTFRSSNDNLTWIAEEGFEKRIELEGGITEILEPYAGFEFNKDLVVETRKDSLSSGSYEKNIQYSMNINNKEDSSKTILGDLKFNAQADNIIDIGWRQYAIWNQTFAKWPFPPEYVIRENEGLGTNIITGFYEPGFLNVDIDRQMNQTVFITEGYQLAKFNVTFKDKNFEWAWARIEANNQYGVDAFVVPGTFTNSNNAPGRFGEWEHGVQFDFDKEQIQTGVNYDFSVILKVRPNDQRAPPIIYKPGFAIGEGLYSNSADGGKGQEVSIPPSMLPENVSTVSASTNTSNAWLLRRHNHAIAKLQDVSDITGPHAEFNIAKTFAVETENDSISSGNYERSVWYGLNIYNEDDDSDTILGDINLSAQADNITGVNWEQYSVWNSSSASWSFPPEFVIRENEGFGAGFDTNYTESRYLGVNLNRWMNRTTFDGDGYQLAKFNVTFMNSEFEGIWGNIAARDLNGVDISIVPGTFTYDAPVNRMDEKLHEINFNLEKGQIQTGFQYNFSVIIRVNNMGNLPVLFKPEFTIGEDMSYNSTAGGTGMSIEIPSSMLLEHVGKVSATTNISNGWKVGQSNQHMARLTGDRTAPLITDFKVIPNKSVGKDNPAVGSAYIFDENLKEVAGAVVDINDLVSTNRTILRIFLNQSGLNGYYVSRPWPGNSWNITNGATDELISAISLDSWKDYIFVNGKFKKNATESEISAVLWFNKTGDMSNITLMDFSATPLLIENGISTFRPVTGKLMYENKSPLEVVGSVFTLYDPGNPENPRIVSSQVRSGTYGALVHAVDLMGYENSEFVDVGVTNGQDPVAVCGPDKLRCENVGSPIQFNGSASYDADGAILSYYWDFGDGKNGSGKEIKHIYNSYRSDGKAYFPFITNLSVTDNDGLTNTSSQKVVIWIPGDVNGDCKVNILDVSIIGLKWRTNDACADLNNDGKVDIIGASIIGLKWGSSCEVIGI